MGIRIAMAIGWDNTKTQIGLKQSGPKKHEARLREPREFPETLLIACTIYGSAGTRMLSFAFNGVAIKTLESES